MPLLPRLLRILHGHGATGIPAKLIARGYDRWIERRYALDTLADVPLAELTITGDATLGHHYEGSRWLPLCGLFRALREHPAAHGTLVDLGSGKGKVLLAAAECGLANVRGVEFAHELCDIARENWRRFAKRSGSRAQCEIIEADVAKYDFQPDETLYFLFNPFAEEVLRRVLEGIRHSQAQHPREVRVVVQHLSPHYRAAFAAAGWQIEREIIAWACRFAVFK